MQEKLLYYWDMLKKICILLAAVFLIGFLLGVLGANRFLPQDAAQDMSALAQQVIADLPLYPIDYSLETKTAFISNFHLLFCIWALGLTVIGIPFLFLLVGLKGFSFGVATSLLLSGNGVPGFLVVLLNVLPVFILLVPLLSITVAWALRFSFYLWQGYFTSPYDLMRGLLAYTGVFCVFILAWLLLSYAQGFLTPALTKGLLAIL